MDIVADDRSFVNFHSIMYYHIFANYALLYFAKGYSLILDTKMVYLLSNPDSDIIVLMIKSSSVVMTSLVVAVLAGLVWFFLFNKAVKIEQENAQ